LESERESYFGATALSPGTAICQSRRKIAKRRFGSGIKILTQQNANLGYINQNAKNIKHKLKESKRKRTIAS